MIKYFLFYLLFLIIKILNIYTFEKVSCIQGGIRYEIGEQYIKNYGQCKICTCSRSDADVCINIFNCTELDCTITNNIECCKKFKCESICFLIS